MEIDARYIKWKRTEKAGDEQKGRKVTKSCFQMYYAFKLKDTGHYW